MIRKNTNISLAITRILSKIAKRPLLLVAALLLIEIMISIKLYSIIPIVFLTIIALGTIPIEVFRPIRFSLVVFALLSLVSSLYLFEVFNRTISFDEYNVNFEGVIESLKYELDGSITYVIDSEDYGRVIMKTSEELLMCPGDKVMFSGNLKKPKEPTNPGEFDYGNFLKNQGISYTLYLKDYEVIKRSFIGEKAGLLQRFFFYIKQQVVQKFEEKQGIAASVFLGDSSLITAKERNVFRKVGCSHLLAVSGTHFSGFLALLPFVFEKYKIRGKKSLCLYALFCFLIGFLTGWSPSVTRSAIMSVSSFAYRDSLSGTSLASIVLLMSNPFNAVSNAFLMSFSCSISIKLFSRRISDLLEKKGFRRGISGTLAVMLSSQIGIIPFWQTSGAYLNPLNFLAQMIESLIAGWVCMLFVPLILLSIVVWSGFSYPLVFIIWIMEKMAELFGKIPAVVVDSKMFGSLITFSVFLAVWALLLYPGILKKIFTILAVILCGFSISNFAYRYLNSPDAIVVFIDVGQGDSCLIISEGRSVLIDAGVYEEGEKTVETVLDYYLIDKVDIACFTHWDSDHAGGIASLYNNNRVNLLCTSYTELNSTVIDFVTENIETSKSVEQFLEEDVLKIGEDDLITFSDTTYLKCISPNCVSDGENEDSVVFEFVSNDFSCLLTGDIGNETELRLLRENKLQSYDILKVAHHGSKYSTSDEFLERIDVTYAIISVGENNSYGHPSDEVLDRLERYRISIIQTQYNGAVQIAIFDKCWSISTYNYP